VSVMCLTRQLGYASTGPLSHPADKYAYYLQQYIGSGSGQCFFLGTCWCIRQTVGELSEYRRVPCRKARRHASGVAVERCV